MPWNHVSMCCPLLLQNPSKQNKDGAMAVVAVVTLSGSCLTLLRGGQLLLAPDRRIHAPSTGQLAKRRTLGLEIGLTDLFIRETNQKHLGLK